MNETNQFILALKGREGIHDGTAVALDGGGHLAKLEVVGAGRPYGEQTSVYAHI